MKLLRCLSCSHTFFDSACISWSVPEPNTFGRTLEVDGCPFCGVTGNMSVVREVEGPLTPEDALTLVVGTSPPALPEDYFKALGENSAQPKIKTESGWLKQLHKYHPELNNKK